MPKSPNIPVNANSLFKLGKIIVDNAQDVRDLNKGIEKFKEAITVALTVEHVTQEDFYFLAQCNQELVKAYERESAGMHQDNIISCKTRAANYLDMAARMKANDFYKKGMSQQNDPAKAKVAIIYFQAAVNLLQEEVINQERDDLQLLSNCHNQLAIASSVLGNKPEKIERYESHGEEPCPSISVSRHILFKPAASAALPESETFEPKGNILM